MKFTLTIDMDNAAFEENENELSTLVHVVGQRIEAGHTEGGVTDRNGNTVGRWEIAS